MLDSPSVCITGASHGPLPNHVSRRGDGAGARVNSQLYATEIHQSKVPPHAGYRQRFDMHVVLGQPIESRRGLFELSVHVDSGHE